MVENDKYLQRVSVPRNARPCLNNVFAGLEKILALDDNLECWLYEFRPGHFANDAANQIIVRLNSQGM